MKQITDEEIVQIIEMINERRIIQVKKMLNNLPNEQLRIKLRTLIRNSGKTNMIEKDKIEKILKDED